MYMVVFWGFGVAFVWCEGGPIVYAVTNKHANIHTPITMCSHLAEHLKDSVIPEDFDLGRKW